jgi:large subunit ribosomal protein L2
MMGHITVRHKGGGHKQHYRLVDFRRNKDGIAAGRAHRVRPEPSANIALLCYADGERALHHCAKGSRGRAAGDERLRGADQAGNTLPIRNIPVGSTIHCVEMMPGKGAQIARRPVTSVQLLAREGIYAQLRLRSGEIRRVHVECRATIGEVGNGEHSLRKIGKAGANRWRGIRPTVRGVAMNPVDHPHGGGEGRTGEGGVPRQPVGAACQGLQDPQQQAHRQDDRAQRRRKR